MEPNSQPIWFLASCETVTFITKSIFMIFDMHRVGFKDESALTVKSSHAKLKTVDFNLVGMLLFILVF